jgi:hypothetical protein
MAPPPSEQTTQPHQRGKTNHNRHCLTPHPEVGQRSTDFRMMGKVEVNVNWRYQAWVLKNSFSLNSQK